MLQDYSVWPKEAGLSAAWAWIKQPISEYAGGALAPSDLSSRLATEEWEILKRVPVAAAVPTLPPALRRQTEMRLFEFMLARRLPG